MINKGGLVAALVLLAIGALLAYGGFSNYADQHSGVAGEAKVTHCTQPHNTKYVHEASRCTGSWVVGGDLITGNGRLAVGRIEGANPRDEGKTIDVRIHGTDHATVPDLKNAILFWAIGGAFLAFGFYVLQYSIRRREDARSGHPADPPLLFAQAHSRSRPRSRRQPHIRWSPGRGP